MIRKQRSVLSVLAVTTSAILLGMFHTAVYAVPTDKLIDQIRVELLAVEAELLTAMKTDHDGIQSDVQSLHDRLTSLQDELATAAVQINLLDSKADSLLTQISTLANDVSLVSDQMTLFEQSVLGTLDSMADSGMSYGESIAVFPHDAGGNPTDWHSVAINIGDVPKKVSLWVSDERDGRWEQRPQNEFTNYDSFSVRVGVFGKIYVFTTMWDEENINYQDDAYVYGRWHFMDSIPVTGDVTVDLYRTGSDPGDDADNVIIRWIIEE